MTNPTPSDLLAHVSEPTYSITEPLTNGVFMTKDAGQAQQTNRMGQPLSSYEAGYEAGYRDGAVALKAATEEVARLKSMAPYVESSGHYCEGMTVAWSDAQQAIGEAQAATERAELDRKSTRLNSSHSQISYAVFCLKK